MRPKTVARLSVMLLAFARLAGAQPEGGEAKPDEATEPEGGEAKPDEAGSDEGEGSEVETTAPADAAAVEKGAQPSQDEAKKKQNKGNEAEPSGQSPPTEQGGAAPTVKPLPAARPAPPAARPAPAPPSPEPSVSLAPGAGSPPAEDSSKDEAARRLEPPYMGFEVFAALLDRVSDSSQYQNDGTADMGYGAGVWYEGDDRLAVGAAYEYSGLGDGKSQMGSDYIDTEYRVHGLWVAGRAYPYRAGGMGVFATVGVGITFMRLSASGTRPRQETQPSEAFLCSGGSTPNLAFAGGAGVSLDVGTQMSFVSQLGAAMYRGTSDYVDACAPGIGSPVTVGVKVGFAYYFGV